MPDGFSDAERERIREELLTAGRDRFSRHGLRKTTIADLAGDVGIAPSTVYQFFDSKADLYLTAVERDGMRVMGRALDASFERYDDPERAIVAFQRTLVDEMESAPLARQFLAGREDVEAHVPPGNEGRTRRQGPIAYLRPYVEELAEADRVRGSDPETIANAIRAVSLVSLHRNAIGEDRYEETIDLLVEAVATGLTTTDED